MRSTNVTRALLAALFVFASAACVRAQRSGPDPEESYRILMQQRMEESARSVNETLRRRFEEGKSDTRFPSDRNKSSTKAGVVRALTPEERKALERNERGLEYFSKN